MRSVPDQPLYTCMFSFIHFDLRVSLIIPEITSRYYISGKFTTLIIALPAELRSIKSKDTFKWHLETHYFRLALTFNIVGPLIAFRFHWFIASLIRCTALLHISVYRHATSNVVNNLTDNLSVCLCRSSVLDSHPLLSAFQVMLFEHIIMCRLITGNKTAAIQEVLTNKHSFIYLTFHS